MSDARKRANAKWDEKNPMKILSCRVYADDAKAFEAYVSTLGNDAAKKTVSKHLAEYVKRCADEYRNTHKERGSGG